MNLEIGDTVKVLPCLKDDVEKRHWDTKMLECIGKQAIITEINSYTESPNIILIFEGKKKDKERYGYYFSDYHLKKINSSLDFDCDEEQIILNQEY
jgi:hypothetical protein